MLLILKITSLFFYSNLFNSGVVSRDLSIVKDVIPKLVTTVEILNLTVIPLDLDIKNLGFALDPHSGPCPYVFVGNYTWRKPRMFNHDVCPFVNEDGKRYYGDAMSNSTQSNSSGTNLEKFDLFRKLYFKETLDV